MTPVVCRCSFHFNVIYYTASDSNRHKTVHTMRDIGLTSAARGQLGTTTRIHVRVIWYVGCRRCVTCVADVISTNRRVDSIRQTTFDYLDNTCKDENRGIREGKEYVLKYLIWQRPQISGVTGEEGEWEDRPG